MTQWGGARLRTALILFVCAGCGGSEERGGSNAPPPPALTSAALTALSSCDEVEGAVRDGALREMNRRLDDALQRYLESDGYCGGGGVDAGVALPDDEGASDVSGTNNQVVGVDEADFVKNDDRFVYVVSDGAFRIIDAWPADEAHEVARVSVEGTPKKLFVTDDRALVYASVGESPDPGGDGFDVYSPGECTYGYDCDFVGDGSGTRVTVYDITDRAEPKLLRTLEMSGSYINARRVGNAVHTVVHEQRATFDDLRDTPFDSYGCDRVSDDAAKKAFKRLRERNARIIRNAPLGELRPSIAEIVQSTGEGEERRELLADCSGFFRSPRADGAGFVTLVSLDLSDASSFSSSTVVSRPGAVYASSEALYLSVRQSQDPSLGWYADVQGASHASTVHKFSLSSEPARSRYVASGVVKGDVLNQFSMDEHEGALRIATTSGHVPDPNVHSTVSVLEQQGAELAVVGKVDDLAPGEDIRSARFSGDRGFVVTFKKTDPLFVLDLANAREPRVLAELKIPGFSTYMHMMDDRHLLTIGYDADEQGDFAYFQGVLLQIFDVSNPEAPRRLHRELIGTRGSSSEALTNHLAFNYFAPKDLLAFPMMICEGGGGGEYGVELTFSGLMVYDVTVDDGFHLHGRVAHPMEEPATGDDYYDSACYNWWTNASSKVKRSIIMDDYVLSVSDELIKINHLDALDVDVASIALSDDDDGETP